MSIDSQTDQVPPPAPNSGARGDSGRASRFRRWLYGPVGLAATAILALFVGIVFGLGTSGASAARVERDDALAREQEEATRLAATTGELETTQADLDAAELEASNLADQLGSSQEEVEALQSEVEAADAAVVAAMERADTAEDDARVAMEKELAPKEAALDERATKLDERKSSLDARSEELDARESKLDLREQELDDRAEDLAAQEAQTSSSMTTGSQSRSASDDDSTGGGSGCHPAYDPCVPGGPDLNCPDVGFRVSVDHSHGDPHGLDGDGDGVGCESY